MRYRSENYSNMGEQIINEVSQLTSQGKYRSAMDVIFEILEEIPNDAFALDLANTVLHAGMSRSNAQSAIEPLTDLYIFDTRLDSLFCECSQCRATWVINPMLRMEMGRKISITNPLGGYCPKCKKVICRNCAEKHRQGLGLSTQVCPVCNTGLEMIREANGRTPRQSRRETTPIKFIVLIREGPVQPTLEYMSEMFHLVSPEVFDDHPKYFLGPLDEWPDDTRMLDQILYEIVEENGYQTSTCKIFHFSADKHGSRFSIAKAY